MGNDMVSLADRVRYLEFFRFGCVAALIGFPLLAPDAAYVEPGDAVAVTGLYALVSVASGLGWRIRRSRGLLLFGSMLLVDGLYLAWVSYATGGSGSLLRSLVLLHLVVVTLLASYRTGLKLALWHSLLLLGAHYAEAADLLPPVETSYEGLPGSGYERLIAFIVTFWLVTLCTAMFSAVNERELRRRRIDLEALAAMANELETARGPAVVAQIVVDRVIEAFGFSRAVLVGGRQGEPGLLAGRGLSRQSTAPIGENAVASGAWDKRATLLVKQLDAVHNPGLLRLLPDARNLLVLPLLADGKPVGILVVEHGHKGSRIEQRVVAMLEQFAAHAALALANAWLVVQMQLIADTDGLTKVANRRTFDLVIEREVQRARLRGELMSLVMVDIDHFKRLNDSYGHQVGDEVLREVASALAGACRAIDTLARYGGEEFAVILPACSATEALVVAERLRQAVQRAPTITPITASVGVATLPGNAREVGDLIEAADGALYQSKDHGRNRVTVSDRQAGPGRTPTTESMAAGALADE